MDDFASAAMMRLVHAGLARQGIALPGSPPSGARVPRAGKATLLGAVLEAHGPAALLCIGEAIPEMPREPVLAALLKASDAHDLLERWSRLERFSHGRHRIEATRLAPDRVRLRHLRRTGDARPSEAETFLVLGVVAALVETITGQAATLWTGSSQLHRGGVPMEMPTLPEDRVVDLTHASGRPRPAPAPSSDADLAQALRARIAEDPVHRWTVAGAARDLGLSARGLQRHLAARGASFSRIVQDVRLEVAGSFLLQQECPSLAEIGFLAGYSDQAHFTRRFTEGVGTAPGAFRTQFA